MGKRSTWRSAAAAGIALLAAGCSGSGSGDGGTGGGPDPETTAITPGAFLAEGGLVAIEFESSNAAGAWSEETAFAGFTGASYLRWNGPNNYSTPGQDTFGFDFWIDDPGRYHFRIHNRHEDPDSTLANDVWVRMDGGDWVKVYSWQRGQWTWTSNHEFSHNDKPLAEYTLTAGNHRIEFSGRSFDFMMDRFHLYTDDVIDPESTSHPESARAPQGTTTANGAATGGAPAPGRGLTVLPFHEPRLRPDGGAGAGPVEEELARLDAALARSAPARERVDRVDAVLVHARSVGHGGVDLTLPLEMRGAALERLAASLAGTGVRWLLELPAGRSVEDLADLADALRRADPAGREVVLRLGPEQRRALEGHPSLERFDRVEVLDGTPGAGEPAER